MENKKYYQEPELEIFAIEVCETIAAGSNVEEGIPLDGDVGDWW